MRKILARTLIVFLISLPGHAWSANYSDPIDGVFKGVYSNTIYVEVPSLISKSPVSGEDQNGDLSFQINPNTGYRNFNQLTDLKYGDAVRVEYTDNPSAKDKQMVANTITKLESGVVANPVSATDNAYVAPAPVTQTTVTTTTTKAISQ